MKRTGVFVASLAVSMMLFAQTREAAVLFSGGGDGMDESYLLTENVSVVFDEDGKALISLDGMDEKEFVLDEDYPVTAEFKDAFKLTANQDLNNTDNYYSTFYTSEGAYKLPDGAKAYVGALEKSGTADILKLTGTELIHQSEPVILKAAQSSITLMPSCNKDAASTGNKLSGTEEGIASAPENVYALSLGQNGVGFYDWSGRTIDAHKAYLTLPGSQLAPGRSLGMKFDDGTFTGIPATIIDQPQDDIIYNLQGQRVDESYRGLIIKNGQKVYNF